MGTKQYQFNFFSAFIKRTADIVFSLCAILFLFPFYVLFSIVLFFSIGTPVFYAQERLGKNFKPFYIYKFRTMQNNAEELGPQLSSDEDERITKIGRVFRKYRLDELPQFWNVLKGDMSIVGPRPEREFYIKQLQKDVGDYDLLFNVRPGITSLGMVNYGYASNLDEMKVRAVFDIDYMKKLSIINDLKVLVKTVLVVLNGQGK